MYVFSASARDSRQVWRTAGTGVVDVNFTPLIALATCVVRTWAFTVTMRGPGRAKCQTLRRISAGSFGNTSKALQRLGSSKAVSVGLLESEGAAGSSDVHSGSFLE